MKKSIKIDTDNSMPVIEITIPKKMIRVIGKSIALRNNILNRISETSIHIMTDEMIRFKNEKKKIIPIAERKDDRIFYSDL